MKGAISFVERGSFDVRGSHRINQLNNWSFTILIPTLIGDSPRRPWNLPNEVILPVSTNSRMTF
jgi:hypothetical protein